MNPHGSGLSAARPQTWLPHPRGTEVDSGGVDWTQHSFAKPLAAWVRRLFPETLAHQVNGVNWRWGLLIDDRNCFPLSLWARFFTKAIEDLDPISTGFPSMIAARVLSQRQCCRTNVGGLSDQDNTCETPSGPAKPLSGCPERVGRKDCLSKRSCRSVRQASSTP
jgi:hypothetical protein